MGFPTTFLVVVLDNIPETMGEIKLNRDKRAIMIHEVSLLVSFRRVCCYFVIFLGDVAFPSSIQRYPRFEDFFCP